MDHNLHEERSKSFQCALAAFLSSRNAKRMPNASHRRISHPFSEVMLLVPLVHIIFPKRNMPDDDKRIGRFKTF